MSERYSQIVKNSQVLFDKEIPIVLEAYAVLRDLEREKYIAQLKLKNCTNKTISSVIISLNTYNELGEHVERVQDFRFYDVDAAPAESFGSQTPIELLRDVSISTLAVEVDSIIYSDGELWTARNNCLLATPLLSDTPFEGKNEPCMFDNSWTCSCGAFNYEVEECVSCGMKKETVFGDLNSEEAKEATNAKLYNEALELMKKESIKDIQKACDILIGLGGYKDAENLIDQTQRRIKKIQIEADKKKQQEQKEQTIAKLKAKRPVFVIVGACLVVLVLVFGVIVPHHKKQVAYNRAKSLLENKNYDEAREAFEELGTYKDSGDQYKKCYYIEAEDALERQDFDSAISCLEYADGYKDSEKKIEAIKETAYEKAKQLYNDGKYKEAGEIFNELADDYYADSYEQARNAENMESYTEIITPVLNGEEVNINEIIERLTSIKENSTGKAGETIDASIRELSSNLLAVTGDYVSNKGFDFNSRHGRYAVSIFENRMSFRIQPDVSGDHFPHGGSGVMYCVLKDKKIISGTFDTEIGDYSFTLNNGTLTVDGDREWSGIYQKR